MAKFNRSLEIAKVVSWSIWTLHSKYHTLAKIIWFKTIQNLSRTNTSEIFETQRIFQIECLELKCQRKNREMRATVTRFTGLNHTTINLSGSWKQLILTITLKTRAFKLSSSSESKQIWNWLRNHHSYNLLSRHTVSKLPLFRTENLSNISKTVQRVALKERGGKD